MKIKLLFLSFVFIYSCSHDPHITLPQKPIAYKTKNVFIIVMDGVRYSESFGDSTYQYIPQLKKLASAGTIADNFFNDGITLTLPGHTALTTGDYQPMSNGGNEIPANVSIFQQYLFQFKKPASDSWIISSKDKLEVLADCLNSKWGGKYKPKTDCGNHGNGTGYREDSITYQHVIDTIKAYHPHLLLINFKQTDAAAHSGNWQEYTKAIQTIDGYISKLWAFLQADTTYVGTTTIFVTNDHGRHLDNVADGFISHGDDCLGCRHIMCMIIGPDCKENYVEQDHYSQIDVFATSCFLLGIKPEHTDGKVMKEILK